MSCWGGDKLSGHGVCCLGDQGTGLALTSECHSTYKHPLARQQTTSSCRSVTGLHYNVLSKSFSINRPHNSTPQPYLLLFTHHMSLTKPSSPFAPHKSNLSGCQPYAFHPSCMFFPQGSRGELSSSYQPGSRSTHSPFLSFMLLFHMQSQICKDCIA